MQRQCTPAARFVNAEYVDANGGILAMKVEPPSTRWHCYPFRVRASRSNGMVGRLGPTLRGSLDRCHMPSEPDVLGASMDVACAARHMGRSHRPRLARSPGRLAGAPRTPRPCRPATRRASLGRAFARPKVAAVEPMPFLTLLLIPGKALGAAWMTVGWAQLPWRCVENAARRSFNSGSVL
jgi:hypothetical protein